MFVDEKKSKTYKTYVDEDAKEVNVKIKDRDHITGKYRGSAHQDCNLNLTITEKSLLRFIIYQIMTQIFYFNKLENVISK